MPPGPWQGTRLQHENLAGRRRNHTSRSDANNWPPKSDRASRLDEGYRNAGLVCLGSDRRSRPHATANWNHGYQTPVVVDRALDCRITHDTSPRVHVRANPSPGRPLAGRPSAHYRLTFLINLHLADLIGGDDLRNAALTQRNGKLTIKWRSCWDRRTPDNRYVTCRC